MTYPAMPVTSLETHTMDLASALDRAIDPDDNDVDRLSYSRTSVRFQVPDTGDHATLLLDRRPPVVTHDDSTAAEVTIDLTPAQAKMFVEGLLPIPSAVYAGRVQATGPVRKYLEVDAMLRERLRLAATGTSPTPAVDVAAMTVPLREGAAAAVDPSLLAIETQGLKKRFGANHVLRGADLQIPEGVVSVILGPSGTGKSVMLRHVIGLLKPDSGEVIVRGRRLSTMSHSELLGLRREVGVMFQDGALFSTMNVYDNVAFPLRQHTDYGETEIRDIVMRHIDAVGLAGAIDRLPNQLSGGMRKRAGLARALALDPGIVLCDEPDSGLDPVRTALLGELIVNQHAENGGTVVVITHNVALAKLISDHISVLWQGTVLAAGTSAEILASEQPLIRQFLAGDSVGPLGMDQA